MKLLKKVNTLVLALAVLLTVGCGKETPAPNANVPQGSQPNQRQCSVTKFRTFIDDTEYDYTYNSAGQVIKVVSTVKNASVTRENYVETIEYNPTGTVSKIVRNFPNSNTIKGYRLLSYNAANQVIEQKYFSRPTAADSIKEQGFEVYQYGAANLLIKLTYYLSGTPATPYSVTNFTYNADGSIRTEKTTPVFNEVEVLDYTFDDKKNPWDNQKYKPTYAAAFPHNPVKIVMNTYRSSGQNSTGSNQYTYTYNADGYSSEKLIPGTTYKETWDYNCQ